MRESRHDLTFFERILINTVLFSFMRLGIQLTSSGYSETSRLISLEMRTNYRKVTFERIVESDVHHPES